MDGMHDPRTILYGNTNSLIEITIPIWNDNFDLFDNWEYDSGWELTNSSYSSQPCKQSDVIGQKGLKS